MTDPRVSVVMPVRNCSRYVSEAAQSILSQSYSNLELIVIDDGSDDDTPEIIDELGNADRRLMLIRQPPSGIVAALNEGIRASRGEFIARMDGDDVAVTNRIERQVAALDSNIDIAVIGTAATMIDGHGAQIGSMMYPTSPKAILDRLPTANCIAHPTVLMRKRVVDAFGGYRAPFAGCEDYDLWLRIAEKHSLANLPEPLLLYRMHDRQCTWRQYEARILAELGAQACSKLRRAGRAEPPMPKLDSVDRAFLDRAGLSPEFIHQRLTERTFGAAIEALRLGLTKAAFAAFLGVLRHDLPISTRFSLASEFFRQFFKSKLAS